MALLAEPRRGNNRQSQTIKSLGQHPEGGEISVKKGRYGPYVNHKRINATLPKGTEPDELTLEEALTLLAAKAAKGKTSKRPTRKKKTTAKTAKTTASKAAAE